jgi:hypothetical protein
MGAFFLPQSFVLSALSAHAKIQNTQSGLITSHSFIHSLPITPFTLLLESIQ